MGCDLDVYYVVEIEYFLLYDVDLFNVVDEECGEQVICDEFGSEGVCWC